MANEGNKTESGKETDIEVEFTVFGDTDLDRFDLLLDRIVDSNGDDYDLTDGELDEFRGMVAGVRRTDGRD